MSGPWDSYVALNDDVRHTYEQVFYGRHLTDSYEPMAADAGNVWTGANGPGAGNASGIEAPAIEGMPIGPGEGSIMAHDHADFYGNTFGAGDAPQIEAPTIDATPVEAAPEIAPPAPPPPPPPAPAGPDMTPG